MVALLFLAALICSLVLLGKGPRAATRLKITRMLAAEGFELVKLKFVPVGREADIYQALVRNPFGNLQKRYFSVGRWDRVLRSSELRDLGPSYRNSYPFR